jgi:hypothetical protein
MRAQGFDVRSGALQMDEEPSHPQLGEVARRRGGEAITPRSPLMDGLLVRLPGSMRMRHADSVTTLHPR